jgi:hypothetical protein
LFVRRKKSKALIFELGREEDSLRAFFGGSDGGWECCARRARSLHVFGGIFARAIGNDVARRSCVVNLRTPDKPGYGEAEAEAVVGLMAPQIKAIERLRLAALV